MNTLIRNETFFAIPRLILKKVFFPNSGSTEAWRMRRARQV